jgi:hypothetical protein
MYRSRISVAMLVAFAVLTAGCGGADITAEGSDQEAAGATEGTQAAFSDACGRAVEEAANIGDMEDTVEDLDEAITACVDLAELGAAVEQYPAALDGADLETFVFNRCQFSEDQLVLESAICSEVGA